MEELKIQDGGCSPFLCCSRECASLSAALRLLFTQTDGSVFALEAASPSNWLSLSPQVAEEAVQVCVCEGLVSFSVWARSLSHTARWLRLFKVCQRLGGVFWWVCGRIISPTVDYPALWWLIDEYVHRSYKEKHMQRAYIHWIITVSSVPNPQMTFRSCKTPYILSRRSLSTMIQKARKLSHRK